jgi:hypothetical protein
MAGMPLSVVWTRQKLWPSAPLRPHRVPEDHQDAVAQAAKPSTDLQDRLPGSGGSTELLDDLHEQRDTALKAMAPHRKRREKMLMAPAIQTVPCCVLIYILRCYLSYIDLLQYVIRTSDNAQAADRLTAEKRLYTGSAYASCGEVDRNQQIIGALGGMGRLHLCRLEHGPGDDCNIVRLP